MAQNIKIPAAEGKATFRGTVAKKLEALLNPQFNNAISSPPRFSNVQQDMRKYCRACAKIKIPLIDVFSDQGILLKLSQCLEHLEVVKRDDNISTSLCNDCIHKIKASHKFFMQYKLSGKRMKSLVESCQAAKFKPIKTPESSPVARPKFNYKIVQESSEENSKSSVVRESPSIEAHESKSEDIDIKFKMEMEEDENDEYIEEFVPIECEINEEPKMEGIANTEADLIHNDLETDSNKNNEIKPSKLKVLQFASSLKQMKLDLDNPSNIQTAPDGTMYVQVEGPNPNEILLVKLRKAEKPIPKKSAEKKLKRMMDAPVAKENIMLMKKKLKLEPEPPPVVEEPPIDLPVAEPPNLNEVESIKDIREPPVVPKVPKKRYHCDFCFKSFSSEEKEQIHSKIHEIHEIYQCDDCAQIFMTRKQRKIHSTICENKLICRYCSESQESRIKKIQHERQHQIDLHGRLCHYCGDRLKNSAALEHHIRRHTNTTNNHECPKCQKKFSQRAKLSLHLKTVHTLLRSFLCDECGADFKNPGSLRQHKIRKHIIQNNPVECPVCQKNVQRFGLARHLISHQAYTLECSKCDRKFKQKSTLRQHMRIHDEQRRHQCDICGVGFNRLDNLRKHKNSVHRSDKPIAVKRFIFKCNICGDRFSNSSLLTIHRNSVHNTGQTFTCHICNRAMVSAFSLDWHLVCIHGQRVPGIDADVDEGGISYPCFHCDMRLKSEASLMKHVKRDHFEKGPVKCPDCEQTFTTEGPFRHHLLSVHNRTEGSLKCPHCDKRCINQNRLKMHMICHTDERPFTCELCGSTFKTRVQLGRHHHNLHTNSRPLQCRYCPWRSKQLSALICHERTHTNERPYSCKVCGQTFKYTSDRNKHLKRHESMGGEGFKRLERRPCRDNQKLIDVQQWEEQEGDSESTVKLEIRKMDTSDDSYEVVFATNSIAEDYEEEVGDEEQVEMIEEEFESTSEEMKIDASEFLSRYRFYVDKDQLKQDIEIKTIPEEEMVEGIVINGTEPEN